MSEEVDKFLESNSEDAQFLAKKAQRLVKELIPDAKEKVQPGWKAIICSLTGGMKDGICAVTLPKRPD